MNYLLVVAGILAAAFMVTKVSSGFKRQKQVLNIIHGKYTFDQLGDDKKSSIEAVALDILQRGGISSSKDRLAGLNDMQRYGVYALAMSELEIHPAIDTFQWMDVSNPMIITDKLVSNAKTAIELFYKEHGVRLSMDIANR